MKKTKLEFREFRPLQALAGAGFERYLASKFRADLMPEGAGLRAGGRESLERLLETNANCLFLSFDFGFPDSTAEKDWDDFARVAEFLKDEGMRAIAVLHPCDYAAEGEFARTPWAARNPGGRPAAFDAPGRFRACPLNEEWTSRLAGLIGRAVERGADGVHLDSLGAGNSPSCVAGRWIGPAGCHCPRCRAAFREASGLAAPRFVDPENETCKAFLLWRAGTLTALVSRLARTARERGAALATGGVDFAVQSNTFVQSGADLNGLAPLLDALIAPNLQMSYWDKNGLIYDAPAVMTLSAAFPGTAAVNCPDWHPLGFNALYPPERFQAAAAEAIAAGGRTLIKTSGYRDLEGRHWTFLSEEARGEHRSRIGSLLRWVDENAEYFEGAEPCARIGLLYPAEAMKWNWPRVAPAYFKLAQTFLELHLLFRIVPDDRLEEIDRAALDVLVVPGLTGAETEGPLEEKIREFLSGGGVVWAGDAPLWARESLNLTPLDLELFEEAHDGPFAALSKTGTGRKALQTLLGFAHRAYFNSRAFHALAGSMDLYTGAVQKPARFKVPKEWKAIHDAVKKASETFGAPPVVEGPAFMHVHPRKRNNGQALHIVNHMPGLPKMDALSIKFPRPVTGKVLVFEDPKIRYFKKETRLVFKPGLYSIVDAEES